MCSKLNLSCLRSLTLTGESEEEEEEEVVEEEEEEELTGAP